MHFLHDNDWKPIPAWANFFLELGALFAREPLDKFRFIVAVSLPTRAFAAAFVAAGIIRQISHGNRATRSNSEHFEFLRELPDGTAVKCVENGKQKTYLLRGTQKIGGEERLIIQMSGKRDGNARSFVSAARCQEFQLADTESSVKDDLLRGQKGKKVHQVSNFAREYLQTAAQTSFTLQTRCDCLLVGRRSLLHDELHQTDFCSNPQNSVFNSVIAGGTLQDVVRVKQFFVSEQPSNAEFVQSDQRRKMINRNLPANAPIVIFDGANGFLKLRDRLRNSHWIVLLDRAETNFAAAIEQINQDFVARYSDDLPADFPALPVGVEAMIYREKLR